MLSRWGSETEGYRLKEAAAYGKQQNWFMRKHVRMAGGLHWKISHWTRLSNGNNSGEPEVSSIAYLVFPLRNKVAVEKKLLAGLFLHSFHKLLSICNHTTQHVMSSVLLTVLSPRGCGGGPENPFQTSNPAIHIAVAIQWAHVPQIICLPWADSLGQRSRFHTIYFLYAGLKVNIPLILTSGIGEPAQMCLDVVDSLYSFKCGS